MEGINVTGGDVNQQATLQDPNANFGFSGQSAQVDQPMAMAENLQIPTDQGQAQGALHPMDPKRLKRVNASREYSQRYRLKQIQYIAQLETAIRSLQAEVAITIPRIKYTDTQNQLLRAENESIRQRLSNSSGKLMFKQAEYHELKKERDMLKQISLQRHAPAAAAAAEMAAQPNHYNMMNNLPMDQSGFNQFTGAGPSNMAAPNQNMGNVQFGFMAPDQTSGNLQFGFGPSGGLDGHGPNTGDNGRRDQM
ncbi:hypothetical protein COLO4_11076 [Corchorus olitorius]|uniref:BZIP domain-containing protein n=1 Tax=Corchorus olitorius TaxID=93759 RepID=A0A1R3K5U3_9ROSI|nr:hypothetical protein COLO4_11076 [Corchorus olitorius]